MTPQEANKIIAEFMGYESNNGKTMYRYIEDLGCCVKNCNYHNDLNTLVPVIDKLNIGHFPEIERHQLYRDDGTPYPVWRARLGFEYGWSEGSIQEAAAIATAKAIQEIKARGE